MFNLFFEIYSEEVANNIQGIGARKIYTSVTQKLEKLFKINLNGSYFFTLKRIGFAIENVPKIVKKNELYIKGPKILSSRIEINGFLKKAMLKNVSSLIQDNDHYYYNKKFEKECSKNPIRAIIELVITKFIWQKSMRWGTSKIRWIRPIRSMLCLFNNEVLPVTFGHIVASDKIYCKDSIDKITSFNQYKKILKGNDINILQEERIKIIKQKAQEVCDLYHIMLIKNDDIIRDISNLVESPYVALGVIEKKFMKLPKEVLISTLKIHQKYILTQDIKGNLAPYFIMVSNIMTNDKLKLVIKGNEKVVKSRLADAAYFYNQDLKIRLIDKFKKLKNLMFHHSIGSYEKRIKDIQSTALNIARKLDINDKEKIVLMSKLIKSDLVSHIVREMPELQGIAGYYYAIANGESIDVANAIKEHYLPQGPNDPVPSNIFSIIMSLADKIVLLNSMFNINIRPTGSKDPYALRRAAIGIIRIVCSNKLYINLADLIDTNVLSFIKERIRILSNKENNIYSINLKYIEYSLSIV